MNRSPLSPPPLPPEAKLTSPVLTAAGRGAHLVVVGGDEDADVVNPPELVCLGLDPAVAVLCHLGERRLTSLYRVGLRVDPDAVAAQLAAREGLQTVPVGLRYHLRCSAEALISAGERPARVA